MLFLIRSVGGPPTARSEATAGATARSPAISRRADGSPQSPLAINLHRSIDRSIDRSLASATVKSMPAHQSIRRMSRRPLCLAWQLASAAAVFSLGLSPQSFQPARFRSGTLPETPIRALGGGEVVVELSIDRDGRVVAVRPLRTTPPFADVVIREVRSWQFAPAENDVPASAGSGGSGPSRARVETKVIVAAVYRPPALLTPTLGESPREVGQPSPESAVPVTTIVPAYPPRAIAGGLVLLEVRVDSDGAAGDVKVLRSAPPFDDVARDTVRRWRFRPARVGATPVSTFVYVILGFRVPVV